MKLVAFTENVADLRVRYSVLHLDGSAVVWADAESAALPAKTGSLPSLALAVPAHVAGADPRAADVLPGPGSLASRELAAMLTRRTGLPVHAHVRLPTGAEPVSDTIALRLLRELRANLNNSNLDE